jgi:8-oxo-dGTP pyrophosphatase MutT (NUDIX family)
MTTREPILFRRLKLEFTQQGYPRMSSHLNPNGAAVLPVTRDGKFILVKETRYLENGEWTPVWNLLRGGRANVEETMVETARRETFEEAGLDVPEHRFVDLGQFYPDMGLSTTSCQLFAAVLYGLPVPEVLQGTDGETLEVRAFSAKELDTMLLEGQLADLFIPAALTLWRVHAKANKWLENGTRNISIQLPSSHIDDKAAWDLEKWHNQHPGSSFEEKSGMLKFYGAWVPLDGEEGPWPDTGHDD